MQVRPGWGTAYHRCPKCGRTIAGCYDDALRAATRPREKPGTCTDFRQDSVAASEEIGDVSPVFRADVAELKARLDRWLADADARNPWRVLGLPTGATLQDARSRFRELAREHHPDRGGDPEAMRKFIRAWHAIRDGRPR
jgi:hypothetical protein